MGSTETLTRALDCVGGDRTRWLLPAGCDVVVHQGRNGTWLVVLDGRVYRADAGAVMVSTRMGARAA